MYKILSYEREGTIFKCKICFIGTTQYPLPNDENILYISEEELDFRLWKQSMIEKQKLTEGEIELLDQYVDKLIEFYINKMCGENNESKKV